MTTKEKIIYEALTLFSIKGYEAVSVRDISRQVGIKVSSLYNHFKNKKDIFDTIINVCGERAMKIYESLNIAQTLNGNIDVYKNISNDLLYQFTSTLFNFYVSDDYMAKFRKVLTIEQYNNQEIGELYRTMFIDQAITYQTMLFSKLMEENLILPANPKSIAISFYAPIFMMLCRYDTYNDEVAALLKNHIEYFALKNSKK